MRRRFLTVANMSVLIIAILTFLFIYQYFKYSNTANTAVEKNAIQKMQSLYEAGLNEVKKANTESGDFEKNLKTISMPSVDSNAVYTLTSISTIGEGHFVQAGNSFTVGSSLYNDFLISKTFLGDYSYYTYLDQVHSHSPAFAAFRDENDEDFYIYSDYSSSVPVIIHIIYPKEIMDGQVAVIKSSSDLFTTSQMVIILLLAIWLFFVHFFDTLKINKNRQLLISAQRRYKTALVSNNNYIWEYDLSKDVMLWDDANSFSKILVDVSGANRKEMIVNGRVHPDDQWAFFRFCDALVTPEPYVETEIRAKNPEGVYTWYRLSGTKVFESDDYPVSVIGQMSDINKSKVEFEELREQASQDPLTKLVNYGAFTEAASKKILTNEDSRIMALLLIDVDDFNDLNESFGYVFADAVLIDIAGRLRKIFPENTIIGRFGGDEFVVLLDNVSSMSYVSELAQNVLTSIHSILSNSKNRYRLSASIGISIFPVDDTRYEGLFEKADTALYDSKTRGKGRYSIYNSNMRKLPEEVKHKRSQKVMLSTSQGKQRTIVDSTILVNAIDILFDSKDLSVSINMMLSLIGIYYNLSRISIILYKEDASAFISHEWVADTLERRSSSDNLSVRDSALLFKGYANDATNCFIRDDVQGSAEAVAINADPFLNGAASLIQCGIRYQEAYTGHINLTSNEIRNWSKSEIDSLSLLSKLIGSYLIQLRSQEKINYVSQMDSLTGTYNLNTFLEKAGQNITSHRSKHFAVIYADVLQFKLINDNYGYRTGDRILVSIAEIMQKVGDASSLVGRVTGDRFIAMYAYKNENDLIDKVKKIIYESKRIKQPNGDFYRLVLMMGVYPVSAGDSAIVAVDRANIARKNVVDYHNCSYMFYNESMHENMLEQKDIEDTMESALATGEFVVYYQPKIDLDTHRLIGSEALVRWIRQGTVISPIRFIPVFEENGFIVQLDYYVLDKVCAMLRKRLDDNLPVKPVSVNFSRVHLSNTVLPSVIEGTLKRYNLPPELIEVEITESALSATNTYQIRILDEIHQLGCRLSMDDFGSGMSSLNILRELPFDVLKIDKDFLHNKVMSTRERVVIRNVVRMAMELDMDVICEGVETEEQEMFLKHIGCKYGQGYLYAKPIPEEDFIEKFLNA